MMMHRQTSSPENVQISCIFCRRSNPLNYFACVAHGSHLHDRYPKTGAGTIYSTAPSSTLLRLFGY